MELKPDQGLLREALGSLYSLFGTTREILRKHGPTVDKPKGEGRLSFGLLAVAVLNTVLHPVSPNGRHPMLEDYESTKPAGVSPLEHGRRWEKAKELRPPLNDVRSKLMDYADILAEVQACPRCFPSSIRRNSLHEHPVFMGLISRAFTSKDMSTKTFLSQAGPRVACKCRSQSGGMSNSARNLSSSSVLSRMLNICIVVANVWRAVKLTIRYQ